MIPDIKILFKINSRYLDLIFRTFPLDSEILLDYVFALALVAMGAGGRPVGMGGPDMSLLGGGHIDALDYERAMERFGAVQVNSFVSVLQLLKSFQRRTVHFESVGSTVLR